MPAMPTMFDRGYTGHEHLDKFELINMGGRVYDPVLSRFLSPDPFVQAPEYGQNYNRYSYAFNNPLKFTDPNGECGFLIFVGLSALMCAILSGSQPDGSFDWGEAGKGAFIGVAMPVGMMGSVLAPFSPALLGVSGALGSAALAGGAMFGSVTLTTGTTSFATNGTFSPNLKAAGISAGITALFAGIEGGISAANDNRNFWTGEIIEEVGGYEGPGKFLNEKIPAGAKPTESGKIVELPSNKNYGKYGWTRKYANGDIKPHFGVDYEGEIGDPVYAIYEGKVVEIGTVKAYGPHHVRTSSIIGGKSYYVDYGHLSKSAVTVNQIVKQSSLIGYMGRQGIPAVFPTHVHIAVWRHIQGGLMGFVQPWWR